MPLQRNVSASPLPSPFQRAITKKKTYQRIALRDVTNTNAKMGASKNTQIQRKGRDTDEVREIAKKKTRIGQIKTAQTTKTARTSSENGKLIDNQSPFYNQVTDQAPTALTQTSKEAESIPSIPKSALSESLPDLVSKLQPYKANAQLAIPPDTIQSSIADVDAEQSPCKARIDKTVITRPPPVVVVAASSPLDEGIFECPTSITFFRPRSLILPSNFSTPSRLVLTPPFDHTKDINFFGDLDDKLDALPDLIGQQPSHQVAPMSEVSAVLSAGSFATAPTSIPSRLPDLYDEAAIARPFTGNNPALPDPVEEATEEVEQTYRSKLRSSSTEPVFTDKVKSPCRVLDVLVPCRTQKMQAKRRKTTDQDIRPVAPLPQAPRKGLCVLITSLPARSKSGKVAVQHIGVLSDTHARNKAQAMGLKHAHVQPPSIQHCHSKASLSQHPLPLQDSMAALLPSTTSFKADIMDLSPSVLLARYLVVL